VPLYNNIAFSINENIYKSKMQEVMSKSEQYLEENGKTVFDIKELISKGVLEPDNELGEYKDPRDNRNMTCDIVNVIYKETGEYEISITENDNCMSSEELQNLYGIITLKLLNNEQNAITKIDGTNWLKENSVFVTYEINEKYKEYENSIEEILWYGDQEKSALKTKLMNVEHLK